MQRSCDRFDQAMGCPNLVLDPLRLRLRCSRLLGCGCLRFSGPRRRLRSLRSAAARALYKFFEFSETLLAVLEILPKLLDVAAFAVDAVAFAVHLLERMPLELHLAIPVDLWFARHLALWIWEGGQRPSVHLCDERFP